MPQAKTITIADLNKLIAAKANVRLIDVRSATEFKERHIPFAEHFPVNKIEAGDFKAHGPDIIVTACGSGGGRSERSASMIAEKFNQEVFYLEGGTFGWFRHEEAVRKANDTFIQKL